ncbi:MAG TPA: hypothetical protein VMC10_11575 [Stellaceae bacterium]|nr:hypothetical protein [Stellaceae bacterium]
MKRLPAMVPIAVIALALASGAVHAQTSSTPSTSGDVGDQFKEGAQSIGQGAERIGEGIKQGAIQAWDAVKAGANAAGEKLNGSAPAAPPPPPAPPPAPPSSSQN